MQSTRTLSHQVASQYGGSHDEVHWLRVLAFHPWRCVLCDRQPISSAHGPVYLTGPTYPSPGNSSPMHSQAVVGLIVDVASPWIVFGDCFVAPVYRHTAISNAAACKNELPCRLVMSYHAVHPILTSADVVLTDFLRAGAAGTAHASQHFGCRARAK